MVFPWKKTMMKTEKRKTRKVVAPKRNLKKKRKKNRTKRRNVVAPKEIDDDDEPDPRAPLREKVGEGIKESCLREVQQFLGRGKTQDYAEIAPFNTLLPVSRKRLRRTYLERLKWSHHIKFDAIHRKVMKTLRRFIEEDDMHFDEAAESAVAKRKFLLNRLMKKKPLPDESDDDKEEENDILETET